MGMIGNRCLEEGAEEFFLKPVRLSDVNRLKPHIMKTKLKDQKQENTDDDDDDDETGNPVLQSQEHPQRQQQQQQHHHQHSNSNKRKALEEGLSPERTRPRYNGVTTVV